MSDYLRKHQHDPLSKRNSLLKMVETRSSLGCSHRRTLSPYFFYTKCLHGYGLWPCKNSFVYLYARTRLSFQLFSRFSEMIEDLFAPFLPPEPPELLMYTPEKSRKSLPLLLEGNLPYRRTRRQSGRKGQLI